eukprot:TRINITY_DN15412_c0_g1_i2.p1 TRINITY_DN15412_c0_g1~~TRINITY_DN15412_c0_g1_i2.p1  ORF type:complete len:192 (-),score=23.74 TRINITY_DN15412_c0_g1_i2:170-745(-)
MQRGLVGSEMCIRDRRRVHGDHSRNLTDEMIKLLADKGGVMGINFCSEFLGKNSISSIEDMISHIKHIRNIGGIDVIALGSDFDGISNQVEIKDSKEFYKLHDALKKEKFTENEIEKIFNKNVVRLFEETLQKYFIIVKQIMHFMMKRGIQDQQIKRKNCTCYRSFQRNWKSYSYRISKRGSECDYQLFQG